MFTVATMGLCLGFVLQIGLINKVVVVFVPEQPLHSAKAFSPCSPTSIKEPGGTQGVGRGCSQYT